MDKTRITHFLVLIVAGLSVFFLYSVSLQSGFVLDDKNNIEKNPHIRITDLSPDSLTGAALESVLPRRPVANVSFALNYLVHGFQVTGFHLVNIFLHLGTSILLYFLIYSILELPRMRKKYGDPGWTPLVTAVIWLALPLHTQTVNYIVQRMTLLAAFFYILSCFLYIKGRTAESSRRKWFYFSGVAIAGFLGLGSKETVAMLPFFLILIEYYFLQDTAKVLPRRIVEVILILLLAAGLITLFYLGKNPMAYILNSYQGRDFTLAQRLLTQGRVVIFYLSLIFLPLPARLNLEHDFPLSMSLVDPLSTVLAIILICLLIISAFVNARKAPLLSFCILWYFGNLLIESSLLGLEIIFEHRAYLPSMFVVMLLVTCVNKVPFPKWTHTTVFILIFFCFMYWTYERNKTWADTVTLLTDSVVKSPNKHRAHLNLGIELKNRGSLGSAIHHYQEALRIKPDYAEAYYNLGNVLVLMGNFKDAAENYFTALSLTPRDVDTHYNLGYTLAKLWRFDEAVYHYSEAVRLRPDYMKARQELAELKLHIQRLYKKKNNLQ